MDFTNKINTGKKINANNSPFKKGKLPTKSIRIRVPYYNFIRDRAFKKECPKSTVIDKIMQYGVNDYKRYNNINNSHK